MSRTRVGIGKLGDDLKQSQRLLNYREAAELLAVGKTTLYDLVGLGEIPVVQFGTGKKRGCTRFRPEDLEAFVEARLIRKNS